MMGQDLFKIEALYDSVSREYAEAFSGEHEKKPKDQEMLRRFTDALYGSRPIWDFGCGPGQTTAYLSNLGLDISGLDLSARILGQARKLHPKIHFQKGNVLDLEFETDTIAGIIAFYSIVHFTKEQVTTAFREIFRVLKPGGLFLVTYHIGDETLHIEEFLGKKIDIDFMLFSSDFISRCLEECGFSDLDLTEREPYPGVEYESRRAYLFARKPLE